MSHVPKFLDYSEDPLDLLDPPERRFRRRHVFAESDVDAVNAALAAGRPLLLRGKPGTGKSQLALAAAVGLGRAYVSEVIDARTESRDLLWRLDAVRRLADAQVASSARLERRRKKLAGSDADELDARYYTEPGPLWWAFHWGSAAAQAAEAGGREPPSRRGCEAKNGVVVLLDEIDKADSSVPNGLLGVLGDGEFTVPGVGEVRCGEVEPLVVITTNEERSLPDAFLRRCAVHHLDLDRDPERLRRWLLRLGAAHFEGLGEAVRERAAQMVIEDRNTLRDEPSPPGGAEYLDLLRVVAERSRSEKDAQTHLDTARRFLVLKRPLDGAP